MKDAFRVLGRPSVIAALIAVLSGCASTPYVDSRREAGQKEPVGPSTPNMVAICYSDYGASQAEVTKLADSECQKTQRVAKFDHKDDWACTFISPVRAFYRCVAKP